MGWAEPNKVQAGIRCTCVTLADKLVDKGSIMFNCAQKWIQMEKERGKGQGDKYEGVFAACDPMDIPSINHYLHMYYDVIPEFDGYLMYFRRKSTVRMPAYCFFVLKQGQFECPEQEGRQEITAHIPGTYFQDFVSGKTKEEVMKEPKEDRPSIVFINNVEMFVNMIKYKLISMGVKEKDILVNLVDYQDKHIPFQFVDPHNPSQPVDQYNPFQYYGKTTRGLFLKDKSFSHQSECRVVVNTADTSIINKLIGNPIEIGSFKEIAVKADDYLDQGAIVKANATIYNVGE